MPERAPDFVYTIYIAAPPERVWSALTDHELTRAVIRDVTAAAGLGDDDRYVGYRWDGSLSETTKSTSDDVRFDLADIDPSGFADMCEEANGLVDDPGDCYLIIGRPDPDDTEQGWISAYVSNEFSQGGYIEYDLDGTEVARHTW